MTERNSAQELEYRSKYGEPFGFEHGDPLVVCLNEAHMQQVIKALGIRAHYVNAPYAAVTGRRYGKAIIFRPRIESFTERDNFNRWVKNSVMTSLGPEDTKKIYFV